MTRIICEECSHFFDPSDKRGRISDDKRFPTLCPLCCYMRYRGDEQWAVWNDCQGIFECRVRLAEVDKLIETEYHDVGARAVPVRVYPEPNDRHDFRRWVENERTARRA
ncbi:hypothetical protein [Bradyrhizobium sp. URHD0069]|uniref:hypothetical protein n=1 Tax=Bradyrhizobium sp. URHD0069 TaxID=1380355 RepID=UPI0004963791|nr:hypothetical protein [Bradyrhizobium sp. URHD0069]